MNPKEYLQQAYLIEQEIKLNNELLLQTYSSLCGKGITYETDGAQRIPQGNSVERNLLQAAEYEERINAAVKKLMQKRLEIEKVIDTVPNATFREILKRRYLLYQKWDDVAEKMHYSSRRVRQLHRSALQYISLNFPI